MIKLVLCIFLVSLACTFQCNGTTGHYISEHSLGQQDEINDTTSKICPTISLKSATDTFSLGSVTLSNITLNCIFYDGSQTGKAGQDTITVTGGKIEFQTNFAISLNESGVVATGTGYASVFSDGTNFTKLLTYGAGANLRWLLAPNTLSNISVKQNFSVKRHSIKNIKPVELTSIQAALNTVSGSVKEQIVAQYNQNFSNILNETLTEEQIFTPEFNYTYHLPSFGDIVIPFRNNVSAFGVNATDGLILKFDTYIKGESLDCKYQVEEHADWKYFGGIQTVHTYDLYQHIFDYSFKNKWLNAELNTDWNTNAFQFYAGDLFEIIPQVSSTIAPRTKLAGSCTGINDTNLKFGKNTTSKFQAVINYNCQIVTQTDIKVAEFDLLVNFILKPTLEYESILLTIDSATGQPTFKTTGQYVVTNFLLAQFKVNEMLKSLSGHRVIGSGFPSWPRDHPNLEVKKDSALYYDSSNIPHFSYE